tara:strand:+ start:2223 stop:3185 length:963 start_codon:yes stop_codon:yes gene_type:complete
MGGILDALLNSSDCVEIVDIEGRVTLTNADADRECPDDEQERMWVSGWPESVRSSALIALEEALDGRKERFLAYRPDAETDRWWDVSVSPIEEDAAITGALIISRDVTKLRSDIEDRDQRAKKAERIAEERDLISKEMRHRLKNQIAAIESLARMTARSHRETADFLPAFSQRLMRLSASQDLLSIRDYEPVPLERAVNTMIAISGRNDQVEVGSMPDVKIAATALTTLALILGELTTNSLKYGALSSDMGCVSVECSESNGILTFTWREDAKDLIEPGEEGNGHHLMARMSANSGIAFEKEWHGTGLTCRFGINSRSAG